jgi:hypothetical protein
MMLIGGLVTIKVALAMGYAKQRGELNLFRDMGLSSEETASITVGYLNEKHEVLAQRKGVFSQFLRAENDLCFLKLNLNDVKNDVGKIVICIDRSVSGGVGPLKEITFSAYNGSPASGADDVYFHVAGLKKAFSVVLVVLSRQGDRWAVGYPGVALEFSSEQWMGGNPSAISNRQNVVGVLRSTLPNALSPEIFRGRFDAPSVTHFLKHSPPSLLSKIYAAGKSFQFGAMTAQASVAEKAAEGGQTLQQYATQMFLGLWQTWPDHALDGDRQGLLKALLADGADWVQAFPVVADDPEGHPIKTLHMRSHHRPRWAAVVLSLIPQSLVLAYANTTEKADALYDINPLKYLMDHISENRRVSTLEADLGL